MHLGPLNFDRRAAAGFEDALLSSLLKIAPAIPSASETSEAPTEWANLSPGEPTYILSNCFWPDRDPRHQSQKEGKSWLDLNAVRLGGPGWAAKLITVREKYTDEKSLSTGLILQRTHFH